VCRTIEDLLDPIFHLISLKISFWKEHKRTVGDALRTVYAYASHSGATMHGVRLTHMLTHYKTIVLHPSFTHA
jgi:hypothetical protein